MYWNQGSTVKRSSWLIKSTVKVFEPKTNACFVTPVYPISVEWSIILFYHAVKQVTGNNYLVGHFFILAVNRIISEVKHECVCH